ncbi:MAG: GNAT family N-acetyltransferase [Solobacterium sp.]|nr:GNAT family N-acetyltransferase [Solobacterium sp.]
MNYTIRLMTIQDYENVYSLWQSCTGMGLNDVDDTLEGITKFLNRNPDTCFVAEMNGQIIGVILTGNDGRRGYIYHTAVHPSCQGNGIGKALVTAAETALKNLGINKTALVVFNRNIKGNAFWEKMGYTLREDISYRNKAYVNITRMDT